MKQQETYRADLDELVFEVRNRAYGAYRLRKEYNRSLSRAALIGFSLFVLVAFGPTIMAQLRAKEDYATTLDLDKEIVLQDVKEIELEKDEPEIIPPKPEIPKVKPPKVKEIAFKTPVPKPDELVADTMTIHDMDSLDKVMNIGLNDRDGDTTMFAPPIDVDTGGTGLFVPEIKEPDPKPGDFILPEKEPKPFNLDDLKKNIGYPSAAKEAEIEGKVVLRVLLNKDGTYKRHIVLKNPHNILTKAVEDQISNLACTPAIQAGKPIKIWITIPFKFSLMR